MKKQLNLRAAVHSFSFLSFHLKETNFKSLMWVNANTFYNLFFVCFVFNVREQLFVLRILSHISTNGDKKIKHQGSSENYLKCSDVNFRQRWIFDKNFFLNVSSGPDMTVVLIITSRGSAAHKTQTSGPQWKKAEKRVPEGKKFENNF